MRDRAAMQTFEKTPSMPGVFATGVLAAIFTFLVAPPASAAVSDELAEELRGYFDAIDTENAETQFARYLTLGRIADDAAMTTLKEATTSDSTNTQLAARFGQVVAGKDGSMEPLVKVMLKTSDLYELLRTRATLLGDETERALIEALLAEVEPVQRRDVYRYLAEQKGPLYDILLERLDDDERREHVVNALRHTLAPHGVTALADRQNDDNEAVAEAAQTLVVEASEVPGRRAEMIPHLKKGLKSDHRAVVIEAATRLLDLNDRAGADDLIDMFFESDDSELRIRLAETMLEYGVSPDTERLESLRQSLTDKIESSGDGGDANKETLQTLADHVFRMLVASGDQDAFKQADKWFRSTEYDRRLVAVSAYGYAGNRESKATKRLSGALFEGREDMRMTAAEALRRLESPESIPALKRAAEKERSLKVKTEVIRALGAIGNDKALEILRLSTGVQQPEVKKAIIRAVREIGDSEGASALRIFQSARNLQVQWEAYVASLALTPDSAMEELTDEVRNPVDGFMQDLLTLPTDTVMTIVPKLLRHPSTQVHEKAVATIRKMGPTGMDFARKAWSDTGAPENVRRDAMFMVSEYRAEDDKSEFTAYLRDNPDGAFSARAAWTLTEYGGEGLESTFRSYLPDLPDENNKKGKKGKGEQQDDETKAKKVEIEHPVLAAISAYGLATIDGE